MITANLTAAHGRYNDNATYRYGNKYSYLDEVFVRHPEIGSETVTVKSNTTFSLRGSIEHAQLLCSFAPTKYPDLDNLPRYTPTQLNDLHPTSAEGIATIE